jgi:hypothetical protein
MVRTPRAIVRPGRDGAHTQSYSTAWTGWCAHPNPQYSLEWNPAEPKPKSVFTFWRVHRGRTLLAHMFVDKCASCWEQLDSCWRSVGEPRNRRLFFRQAHPAITLMKANSPFTISVPFVLCSKWVHNKSGDGGNAQYLTSWSTKIIQIIFKDFNSYLAIVNWVPGCRTPSDMAGKCEWTSSRRQRVVPISELTTCVGALFAHDFTSVVRAMWKATYSFKYPGLLFRLYRFCVAGYGIESR